MNAIKAFLAIKYFPDNSNRSLIECLTKALHKAGFDPRVIARDVEEWGKTTLSPQALMASSFALIQESQVVFIEATEKGVGIGIEAGYAYAAGIPIVVIARFGTDISTTLRGVSAQIIFYDQPEDLANAVFSY